MSDRRINKGFVRATTPDPLSLESLVGWLETMPADGEYNALSTKACLLCQYGEARFGHRYFHETAFAFRGAGLEPPVAIITLRPPHTFGAALERARALSEKSNG